jgi:hypothetical protein
VTARQCSKAGESDSKSDWRGSIPRACVLGEAKGAWVNAETLRVVLLNQQYKTAVLPAGWKALQLPMESK